MACFPQLKTGTAAHFPCTKRVRQRTVVNQQADGGAVKLFDPGACTAEWEINFVGLDSEEWDSIRTLFEACEGRLGSFVFLDPFDNLLKWSEDLSAAAWTVDAGITLVSGVSDPLGGTGATQVTNASGPARGFRQTVSAPAGYQYCFSTYVRSAAAATVTLSISAGSSMSELSVATGPAWRRVEMPVQLASQDETITFQVALAGGATVELFGLQAEPQVGASRYKKTGAQSGVYANASFLDDVLAMTSDAPGAYSCPVRITANASH
jgi:hypothetical protein